MIGIYDYTVILTYISLLSAGSGIVVSLSGGGHPYLGTFFLLLCGLCDAFDGKVARTKKDRSDVGKRFGIQIDSLSDIVAFGVLPACIGAAMLRTSTFFADVVRTDSGVWYFVVLRFALFAILVLYILAAMIRLAYYNVTEEDRQKVEEGNRKYFVGLPVTSAALIVPIVILLQFLTTFDLTWLYFAVIIGMGVAFLSKFKVKKPGLTGILIMIGIGFIEFVLLLIFKYYIWKA
ncbi:MAG: CDP-alcohol phosphatidyltransferase family protein [Clostridia bacterium]|nr:CDP-alcohol phosphatidyltransferase family protein [Clostridia bacterium]